MELIDILFLFICSIMVIGMAIGFSLVESGLCQQKNTVNILTKNLIVFSISVIGYYLLGYKLMYDVPIVTPSEKINFLFQASFVATSATIVSGLVAERIKILSFMIFSLVLTSVLYPIQGSFVWNNGWLAELGFTDFAGSTVVHSFGAFAGLAGTIVLGSRLKGLNVPGHNYTSISTGGLLLYIFWLGFNGGSELALTETVPHIALVTIAGGAVASVSTTLYLLVSRNKLDLSMIVNGLLAGLVSITAGANVLTINEAIITSFIAGILVVKSVQILKWYKIDDVVGAFSVHGTCGILGTLALGVFGHAPITTQLLGVVFINFYSFITSMAIWVLLKLTIGIRVSPEEETLGLDLTEHGQRAYADFVIDNVSIR